MSAPRTIWVSMLCFLLSACVRSQSLQHAHTLSSVRAAAFALDKRALLLSSFSDADLREALFELFREHDPTLSSSSMLPAMKRDTLAQLLVEAAFVSRSKQRMCSADAHIDLVHSSSAFTMGCGDNMESVRQMRDAPFGRRTIPCYKVALLSPMLETTCASAEESSDLNTFPYHWHPVLPFVRAPEAYYQNCSRFEVVATYDGFPGPLWMYAAPGSGAWWDPRNCLQVVNSVAAAIHINGVSKVAGVLNRSLEQGGLDAWRFRLLFGADWETLLLAAAEGKDRRALIAAHNHIWNALIPGSELRAFDSLIYLRQMNAGRYASIPVPEAGPVHATVFLAHMFDSRSNMCAPRARLEEVLLFAPEVIDLEVGRQSGWEGGPLGTGRRDFKRQRILLASNLRAGSNGVKHCPPVQSRLSCLSCTERVRAGCTCSQASHAFRSSFDPEKLHRCCMRQVTTQWYPVYDDATQPGKISTPAFSGVVKAMTPKRGGGGKFEWVGRAY